MSAGFEWPEDAFWDYSLALYGRSGVERACLDLQRRHDLDLNLLLLCCWLAARGIEIDDAGLAAARAAAGSWQQEVVRPLRAIRRRLKIRLAQPEPGSAEEGWPDLAGRLRARILDLELHGEHLEQLALARAVAGRGSRAAPCAALAATNLGRYWRFEESDRPALEALLRAAFPGLPPDDVAGHVRTIARPLEDR